jgi:hypothetical protein
MCNSTLNSISDSFPAFSITENDVSVFNGWLYKFFMKANIVLFNNIDESQIFTIICNYDINSLITSYSSEPTDKLDSFIKKLENGYYSILTNLNDDLGIQEQEYNLSDISKVYGKIEQNFELNEKLIEEELLETYKL